jgi:hypothetical protein
VVESHAKLSKRPAELGASRIETVKDTCALQIDMLRRLKHSGIDRGYYVGLDECGVAYCGRVNCAEACWFGARRRRLREMAAVQSLFQKCQGPHYEVRIIRESWQQPIGELKVGSIAAAKQFKRRRLDTL